MYRVHKNADGLAFFPVLLAGSEFSNRKQKHGGLGKMLGRRALRRRLGLNKKYKTIISVY